MISTAPQTDCTHSLWCLDFDCSGVHMHTILGQGFHCTIVKGGEIDAF